jgi:hypothetical protein
MLGGKKLESIQQKQKRKKQSSKEWFDSVKSAIVVEDFNRLETLSAGELPEFQSVEEMQKAQFLVREIMILLVDFRNNLQTNMVKVERNIKNLKSLLEPRHKLDKKA